MPRAKAPTVPHRSGGFVTRPSEEQIDALAARHALAEPIARAVLVAAMTEASFTPPPSAAQTIAALAEVSRLASELGRAIDALGDDARDAIDLAAQTPSLRTLQDIDRRLEAPELTEAERADLARAREPWEAKWVQDFSLGRDLFRRMKADIVTLTVTAKYAQQGLGHRGRGNPHAIDARIGKAVLDALAGAGIAVDRGKNSRARDILQDVLGVIGLAPEGAETIIRGWQKKNRHPS